MYSAITNLRDRLDRTGVWLSGLCALHCVVSVVLVSVLGLGGQFLLDPAIHEFGLIAALVVGTISLGYGVMRHGRMGPLAIGATGLLLMALAIGTHHGIEEAALTIAGVALVAIAHIRNLHPSA
jgi:hypothetical protein